MNTKVKQRVAIGIGIWFACALINAFFAQPPVRDVKQHSVLVATAVATEAVTAATDEQSPSSENAAELAASASVTATTAQTTTTVTDTPIVTTNSAIVTESNALTDSNASSPMVEVAAVITEATALTTATDTTLVEVALADTATTANVDPSAQIPSAETTDSALVTVGENVFQHTAGGVGCQLCHGPDAKGLIGPNIVGKTADDIRFQFENNDQMKFITLTDQEIAAVAIYLQYLANPAAFVMPVGNDSSQPATTAAAPSPADPVLASGQEIFQVTAGGVGCQLCHGPDAKGLIGPSIVGKTAEDIRTQFETNDQMKFIVLNNQEIEAVATYLQYLADPNAVALTTSAAAQSETTAAAPAIDDPAVAAGEQVFQVTAGGVGCQLCHGPDATGLIGPNIVGKTADDIRFQFENNDQMKFILLTDGEIEAVATYLQYLAAK